MNVVEVAAPGLFTTVQDLGREGFGPQGVSPSGAADAISLRLGNRLVGNTENAPALEMTLLGGNFVFREGTVAALTGSDFGATLNDEPVAMWASFKAQPGATLRVGATRSGARCYLCVAGGFAVGEFLGSASTHILSGTGGFAGRALIKGDLLQIGEPVEPFRPRRVARETLQNLSPRKDLRATIGPQSTWFSAVAQDLFYKSAYRVTEECNRMGLRLDGPPVAREVESSMISEGVSSGAVQITAAGLPIILFVEQQTAGGYPKIANVVSADLPSVGQLRPRDELHFSVIDFQTAQALLRAQEVWLTAPASIEE